MGKLVSETDFRSVLLMYFFFCNTTFLHAFLKLPRLVHLYLLYTFLKGIWGRKSWLSLQDWRKLLRAIRLIALNKLNRILPKSHFFVFGRRRLEPEFCHGDHL